MTEQNHPAPAVADNPLLETWTAPFEVPPFGRIAPEHFTPAYERAFAEHDAEIAAIAADPAAPTFTNTIEAMGLAGRQLDRVGSVFGVLAGAHTHDALLPVEREVSARRAPPLDRPPSDGAPGPPHRRALASPRRARPQRRTGARARTLSCDVQPRRGRARCRGEETPRRDQ